MSNDYKYSDLMNQFNLEDESNEHSSSLKESQFERHKTSSSLVDKIDMKIEKKLTDITNNNQRISKKKPTRDKFGYFFNYKENQENEPHSLNSENNDNNDDYYGKVDSGEEKNESNEYLGNNDLDKFNENIKINNSDNKEENNKFSDKNIYEKLYEEKEEQNNSNKEKNYNDHENLDSIEGDEFRMDSFRPKPIPSSPKFINDKIKYNDNKKTDDENTNCSNFTETLKTKIEGDNLIKNSFNDNNNNNNPIYSQDSNLSLGKISNKDNITSSSQYNKNSNPPIKNINEGKIPENNKEEQLEEDFLKKEELKRKKNKELIENENNIIENKEEFEEEGKENVIDDDENEDEEERAQIEYLRNLEEKKKKLKKYQEEIKSNQNIDINDNINLNNKTMNSNRIKNMPIKLLRHYINEERQKKEEILSKTENNIDINIKNSNNNDLNKNNIKKKSIGKNKYNKTNNKNNKIYLHKNQNLKKTEINKFASPSTRNTNHFNYYLNTSKNKNKIISSFNINSNKINNNRNNKSNKIYTNKYINNVDLNKIKKRLYAKKEIKPIKKKKKNLIYKSPPRPRPKKAVDYHEKYSFTPTIDENSKKILERRNKISPKNYNKKNYSFGERLYEDANKKREKMKQKYLTEDNNIKLNANISKINKKSHNIAIERANKKISNIIKKYSQNEKISIINIAQCLCDLKIINELIKKEQILELNLEKIKDIIEKVNGKDQKKIEEIELLEQIWFKINPSCDEYINSQHFYELLKILFSSDISDLNEIEINKLSINIENLLYKYSVNSKKDSINNQCIFISPIRDKNYEENDLWDISKLIKIFLKLKSNIKAYRDIDYQNKQKEISNNLREEREKELTFEPDISQSNYVFNKNSKFNCYNTDNKGFLNLTCSNISKKPKHDFNKIYERFMKEKKMHEKVLEKLREIKNQKELKKCTHFPKISQYSQKNIDRMNLTMDSLYSPKLSRNKKTPIYERLYSMRKKNDAIKSNKNNRWNKSNLTEKALSEDKKINKKKKEQIHNIKIKPFNMNDSNENNYKKNEVIKEKNKYSNIIDNIYITLEIKIPNGELKPIKIYKNQNNIIETINQFCETYKINREERKIIFNKVIQYKNSFFGKDSIEEDNDININEDMDTICNTNYIESKNSNESRKKTNNKTDKKSNNYEIINNQYNDLKTVDDYITYKNENK